MIFSSSVMITLAFGDITLNTMVAITKTFVFTYYETMYYSFVDFPKYTKSFLKRYRHSTAAPYFHFSSINQSFEMIIDQT